MPYITTTHSYGKVFRFVMKYLFHPLHNPFSLNLSMWTFYVQDSSGHEGEQEQEYEGGWR